MALLDQPVLSEVARFALASITLKGHGADANTGKPPIDSRVREHMASFWAGLGPGQVSQRFATLKFNQPTLLAAGPVSDPQTSFRRSCHRQCSRTVFSGSLEADYVNQRLSQTSAEKINSDIFFNIRACCQDWETIRILDVVAKLSCQSSVSSSIPTVLKKPVGSRQEPYPPGTV